MAKEFTAQELRDWLDGYGRDEYKPRCSMRSGSFNSSMLRVFLRLVDDVERWKKMMRIGPPEGGMWRVSEEIQGYKYGGEEGGQ